MCLIVNLWQLADFVGVWCGVFVGLRFNERSALSHCCVSSLDCSWNTFLYTNELIIWLWIWLILEISIEIAKKLTWTTFSNGYLGSRNDEERSEMRYVVRIAKLSESSKFWTQIALLGIPWSMLLWESFLYQLEHVKVYFYGQVCSNLWHFWLISAFGVWITGSTLLCCLRLVLFALCLLIDL